MKTIKISLSLMLLITCNFCHSQTLAEKLGYKPTDRLLIINCDDVGMCHSANLAVIEGMETGLITSGTIMTPCPWFNEIADYTHTHPEKDFGVHLTHTAEWKFYRWGPVAPHEIVKGLCDPEGFLWRSVEEVYAYATSEEALIEGRAQIKKATDAGIPVTHIDSHMGTMQYKPEYLKAYIQLALEFNLPLRMAAQSTMEGFGFPELRNQFKEKGLVFTDYFVYDEMENYKDVKSFWTNIIKNLKPGVTEIFIHASKESDELKAITNSWETRVQEADLYTNDPDIRKLIKDEKIILIGYRPLMELQKRKK
ncbi:MAG: polysaccharide deacetylase family protein [Bacteroidales bacterium]|nr:polysaccharide deacetylase family protein [Bacteroidales bacterium]MDP3003712.1 polysaccharide deacetylase family protein [Bacteroidales bacterium]